MEEILLPITYTANRGEVERILLAGAHAHASSTTRPPSAGLAVKRSRFALSDASLAPAVYWRITDNWLELSLRFLVPHRGVREIKDRMTRDIPPTSTTPPSASLRPTILTTGRPP